VRSHLRRIGLAAGASAATAVTLHVLGLSPWSGGQGAAFPEFVSIASLVGACALFDLPAPRSDRGAVLRLSFVAEFAVLILFGPTAMTIVAGFGSLNRMLNGPLRRDRLRDGVVDVLAVVAASQAAGLSLAAAGGASLPFEWPIDALPFASAVVAYSVVATTVEDVIGPLTTGARASRRWPGEALRGVSVHVVAAALALALLELLHRGAWDLLPIVAVPLYFAWRTYAAHEREAATPRQRLDAMRSRQHAIAAVDRAGVVVAWNQSVAALLDCPASRVIGHDVTAAVPAPVSPALSAALRDVLANRVVRSVAPVHVANASAQGRELSVTIVPDADGAALIWSDVTDRAQEERTLRRRAETFALIAAGSSDGVWELDDAGQRLFVSARWRSLMGLPDGAANVGAEEWFDRIHPDDVDAVRTSLERLSRGEIASMEQEHRIRRDDGSYRRVSCRCIAERRQGGRGVRIGGSLTDLDAAAAVREQATASAGSDPLTGLPNRAEFLARVAERLGSFKDRRTGRFAVLYLGLDRFKVVNNSLGHAIGDELLTAVSRRLESCLRKGDCIARLGGDEFGVLLNKVGDEMQANVVAFRLQDALQAPFEIGGRSVVTSVSIGIAFGRVEYASGDEILRDADTAMSQAKANGKARHELFDADAHTRAVDRLGLESDLRHAVKACAFEVHYQPIVALGTRMCIGFESLVRWTRNGKPVPPSEFVPMAEELGIIEPLGTWVMQEACRTFQGWRQRHPGCELDCITVNVSARQLVQQGFAYLVEQVVEQNGMDPASLRIEITETALMDAPQAAAKVLAELRAFGVKVYLDDFGTGYSSLSHLHKLPVDALKIDRSFVRGLLVDDRPAIVESIIALARTLHTSVVAEGVEDEGQALELERLGCRQAQGFYFSRPLPAAAIEQMLIARQPLGGPRSAALPARPGLRAVQAREIA
jgi:diguanylate cyclase (GGDEF)-like protein/PAS domain S-box-containing protein